MATTGKYRLRATNWQYNVRDHTEVCETLKIALKRAIELSPKYKAIQILTPIKGDPFKDKLVGQVSAIRTGFDVANYKYVYISENKVRELTKSGYIKRD